jgi:hypothetical protein
MALPAELMENVPTLEEFWAAFTKSQAKLARNEEEAAARQREEEAARRAEEAARQKEEAARRAEWERGMAELRAAHRETERVVRRVSKQMGDLHNRFGELAEHLVAPGIIRRFNELGYHFDDTIAERVRLLDSTGQKILTEIDLLLENGDYSIAVEVKSRPTEKDVVHQENRLTILREHKNRRNDKRKIRGAIAGAVFPEDVKAATIEAGLYVIEQSGDTMKITVPEGFTPRDW